MLQQKLEKCLVGNEAAMTFIIDIIESDLSNENIDLILQFFQHHSNVPINNSFAQNILGIVYRYGFDIKDKTRINYDTNHPLSIKWLQKSANQGNSYALYNLGHCLYSERRNEKEQEKGLELLQESARLMNPYAHDVLANILLEEEEKVKSNLKQLSVHTTIALKAGLFHSALSLASYYFTQSMYDDAFNLYCSCIQNGYDITIWATDILNLKRICMSSFIRFVPDQFEWLLCYASSTTKISCGSLLEDVMTSHELFDQPINIWHLLQMGVHPCRIGIIVSSFRSCSSEEHIPKLLTYFSECLAIKRFMLFKVVSISPDCMQIIGSYLPWFNNFNVDQFI